MLKPQNQMQRADSIRKIVYLETLICTPKRGGEVGDRVNAGKKEELSLDRDNASLMGIIFHPLFEYLK